MYSGHKYTLLLLLLAGVSFAEHGSDRAMFSSGAHRVALIELYTSEGCSSCPPADRWLSGLKGDPRLWSDFVPIALHVDYWNYIGWKDRFARSDFSERQRRYISEGGARVVYTPGFFVNGQEWQRRHRQEPDLAGDSIAGNLTVLVDGHDVAVRFASAPEDDTALLVHVAVVGMNLETRVRAGENKGRTLRHDFVALGVATTPLKAVTGGYEATSRLPAPSVQHDQLALVAWVSGSQKQLPIQAVGGYLP